MTRRNEFLKQLRDTGLAEGKDGSGRPRTCVSMRTLTFSTSLSCWVHKKCSGIKGPLKVDPGSKMCG